MQIIDILAQFVTATIGVMGYWGVFLLMLVESCGILMPSEVIMPFSGFLVASGELNFWLVATIGALGNLAGSLVAYWIGYRGGRPLIEKYGKYILISKHDLNMADRWFTNHGEITVFFGRLLPVVRTFISFPAGIAKMNMKKFIVFTFLGALPWCVIFTYLGVRLGDNWDMIRERLHNFDVSIAVLIIILVGLYIYRHIKHLKEA